jgi:hypothetical protein
MRGQMTHLDHDVLAEFRAGLITGRRGARIAAHLAGCDRCTALDGQLAGVSVLLASVPAPALPDRVAQRLDTVLAAEVARRDNPERARGDGAGTSAAPGRPAGHRGFPPWTWRVLVPAGAAVVLAAGGFGLSQIGHGSLNGSATSSAGRAAQASSGVKSAASRANAPAASPIQGVLPRPLRMTPANFLTTTSSTDFARATLKQQVEADLRAPTVPGTTHLPSAPVRACVRWLAGGDTLQLVENARFEDQPALLVVARAGQDDTAWITVPDCSATNRHVLATTSVPAGISEP